MRHFQDSIIDLVVGWRESRDEVLDEGVPSLPEVGICDDADRFTELSLNRRGAKDHEPDKLLFYRVYLVDGEFVVSVLVLRRTHISDTVCKEGRVYIV